MSIWATSGGNTGWTQVNSAHGNATYSNPGGALSFVTSVNEATGSCWLIWRVQSNAIPAGEPLQFVRFEGGHDFLVGSGGGSGARSAAALGMVAKSVAAFSGALGTQIGAAITGNGVGANVKADLAVAGITSDDIRAGNCYVGIAVNTGTGASALGAGQYRTAIVSWTFYTATSTPTPPAGDPGGIITNPADNIHGKYPGAQFSSVYAGWTGPGQQYLDFRWNTGHNNITFAASGLRTLTDTGGVLGDPAKPYMSDTGLINIGAGVPAGDYTISCQFQDQIGNPDVVVTSTLRVLAWPDYGQMWMEA